MSLRDHTDGATRITPSTGGGVDDASDVSTTAPPKDRHAGITCPRRRHRVVQIGAHHLRTGPDAGMLVLAETTLVIGQGGDALFGPEAARPIKGIGIVAHAMQRYDHRAWTPLRLPAPERQPHA